MKTILLVAASAAGGVVVGNMIHEQVAKIEAVAKAKPSTREALRVGEQAAAATLLFGLLARTF
ncbi:MAG: hypothetical protein D6744_07370 [Planctomycetota bacterium]|nr:MAG: hypothetical protein D6744_07370 [Planctomycetota bacterium]